MFSSHASGVSCSLCFLKSVRVILNMFLSEWLVSEPDANILKAFKLYQPAGRRPLKDSSIDRTCLLWFSFHFLSGMDVRALLFAPLLALCSLPVTLSGELPKGLDYIGVGYNLLRGNPEGSLSTGGVDPGLLVTRKIFKLTWKEKKTTVGRTAEIPDEMTYVRRQSCTTVTHKSVLSGAKSYQKKLNVDASASGKFLKANTR